MVLHIFTILIGFNLCTDENNDKNVEHKENSFTSNDSQQLLRPESSHSETSIQQQIQSQENALPTSAIFSLQLSASPIQVEPLDLTTSPRQRGIILTSRDKFIQYKPFKRPWEIVDDQIPGPSAQKLARFEVNTQSQKTTQDLSQSLYQSRKISKRKQKTPSKHEEYCGQSEEVAGPSTYQENLDIFGACASEEKNYSEQEQAVNQQHSVSEYENLHTLNDIFVKYGHVIEQSKLTIKSFIDCREIIQKEIYKFEKKINDKCAAVSIKFNHQIRANEIINKNMYLRIHTIREFKQNPSVFTFFGSSYKTFGVKILCNFLIPNDFIYEKIGDSETPLINNHIKRIENNHLNVTMNFWEVNRRKGHPDDPWKVPRRYLFHIPLPITKSLSIEMFFIGFHNGQALLFRYISSAFNNLCFAIELLDNKNCKFLSHSQRILIS
ncbi:hypothetical protein M153_3020006149 [Pseudoloma neurophilia]|uniref:Uncharacterized protein n=1 Tax=Pseudoloma neurophilia TaxID=146866 RepID=A0A0R0M2F6_9MICR|nr:hypothetical protein M153_3020006149 [Pseudoloma neurophilia]